jgi:hypothetical protein
MCEVGPLSDNGGYPLSPKFFRPQHPQYFFRPHLWYLFQPSPKYTTISIHHLNTTIWTQPSQHNHLNTITTISRQPSQYNHLYNHLYTTISIQPLATTFFVQLFSGHLNTTISIQPSQYNHLYSTISIQPSLYIINQSYLTFLFYVRKISDTFIFDVMVDRGSCSTIAELNFIHRWFNTKPQYFRIIFRSNLGYWS